MTTTSHEARRNAAVEAYRVFDAEPDVDFDALAALARDVCTTPIALVTFVHRDRLWAKARVGFDTVVNPRDTSFCTHAIVEPDEIFLVEDARADARFARNPLVAGEPYVRFYAGATIRSNDGYALGTLCVLDYETRTLGPSARIALQTLATAVEARLELRRRNFDLARERRLVTVALDAMLVASDGDGRIVAANDAAVRLYGYATDELLAMTLHDLHRPGSLSDVSLVLPGPDERVAFETIHARKDGTSFPVHISAENASLGDDRVVFAAVRDVSDRIRVAMLEDERDRVPGLATFERLHARLTDVVAGTDPAHRAAAVLAIEIGPLDRDDEERSARALVERLRTFARPNDVFARLRECTFALVLMDVDDAAVAERIASDLLARLALPLPGAAREMRVRANVGIALTGAGFEAAGDVMRAAEIATERAKAVGTQRSCTFTRELYSRALDELRLESDLAMALGRGEFALSYQPIVALATGRIAGFEALLRWKHATRGVVMPDTFVPLAERTGEIVAIGEWVLDEAYRCARRWRTTYRTLESFAVAVNVSTKQLADASFLSNMRRRIADGPPCVRVEITETALMVDVEASIRTLATLRAMGIRVDLDDFGTGYSSLAYVHRLPVGALKIDRTFVGTGGAGLANEHIVRTIVDLARNLEFDTIAEGIETPEQLASLRALGCAWGQGYYLARPVDEAAASALLQVGRIVR